MFKVAFVCRCETQLILRTCITKQCTSDDILCLNISRDSCQWAERNQHFVEFKTSKHCRTSWSCCWKKFRKVKVDNERPEFFFHESKVFSRFTMCNCALSFHLLELSIVENNCCGCWLFAYCHLSHFLQYFPGDGVLWTRFSFPPR